MSLNFDEFFLPFDGKLDGNNRWVKLAALVPWDTFEDHYVDQFSATNGAAALSFRVALGALIIKERLRITDREAVEQICRSTHDVLVRIPGIGNAEYLHHDRPELHQSPGSHVRFDPGTEV